MKQGLFSWETPFGTYANERPNLHRFVDQRRDRGLNALIRTDFLDGEPQFARGIFVVYLAKDRWRKVKPGDAPTPLRWHLCRSIVKVLVIGFQESVVDFVEFAAK